MERRERSAAQKVCESLLAVLELSGPVIGILKSPLAGFIVTVLASGGIVAALLIRRLGRDQILSIR